MIPTFDEWFAAKNSGRTFEQEHMQPSMRFSDSLRELTRQMREYTTEMVQSTLAKPS